MISIPWRDLREPPNADREVLHAMIALATRKWLRERGLRAVPRVNAPSLMGRDAQAQIGLLGPIQSKREQRRLEQEQRIAKMGFQVPLRMKG